MGESPAPESGEPSAARTSAAGGAGPFRHLAELLALTAFAIAQPVLDVTGRAPDFFLYRQANRNEMRLFVALVVLLPPLALWVTELVVGLVSRKAARFLHLAYAGILFAAIVVQVGKKLGLFTGIPLGILAVLAGAGIALLLGEKRGFRQAVLYATPAPLVFALLFVFTAPAGALVRGAEVDRGRGRVIANRPPVVFLFLDEFPLRALLDGKGQIDATLYPNFARLQKISNWYPNATGVTGWTPFAAPAMLRGKYPEKAVAASYILYPETLFTFLSGQYEMRAYETIAELCPPGFCHSVAAGREVGMRALTKDTVDLTEELMSPYKSKKATTEQFVEDGVQVAKQAGEGKKPPDAQARFGEVAKNQPNRLGPFLADLKPMPQPNLHFMHLLLPHSPWHYLPSGNEYQRWPPSFPPEKPDPTKPKHTTPSEPLDSLIAKQRLLLQTAYLDNQMGVMLDRMEETGLLDQALLIVTADHGTGIEPRTKARQMDDANPADLAWVPLFVKEPGQKTGRTDDRNAMHVDLLPTIADVLNTEVPWKMDGVSLLGPPRQEQQKVWYDVPGVRKTIDPAKWRDKVRLGYAAEIAKPGREGLFAVGPHKDLVGKKVSELTVGAPSPATADMHQMVESLDDVDPARARVPAALFGSLDRPMGTESTWLVASVNGTIAGAIAAVPSDGTWKFLGMVNDKYFTKGKADIGIWSVEGSTLHRLNLKP
ncbi:MAG TPA: sulfatase-like hydrolase/transferase [Frankiaceae bacterium]|nr:sulfatase-like hydrolase/transferase [Frankiaceae bacterium]